VIAEVDRSGPRRQRATLRARRTEQARVANVLMAVQDQFAECGRGLVGDEGFEPPTPSV
jgi:hypothetical protein